MVISTYQAASGAGQAAMDELELQTKEVLEGKEVTKNIFPFQVRFLCTTDYHHCFCYKNLFVAIMHSLCMCTGYYCMSGPGDVGGGVDGGVVYDGLGDNMPNLNW